MTVDLANAVFELAGGLLMWVNVRRLLRDRVVRGQDWRVMAFFTAWSAWDLYYYPSLGQPLSAVMALSLASANVVYLALMVRYILLEREGVRGAVPRRTIRTDTEEE